ncbi:MAG TPA: YbaK/EbsC family protein [Synergistales bacterium]|nr:YbaK/EbsC family protein [Synergistales bacterium]
MTGEERERQLRDCGFPFELLENRVRIRSASEGAAYWGIELGATAPALVLRAQGGFWLLLVSGAIRKVDFAALGRETGEEGMRLATSAEILERFGLKPGEVPLFGLGLPTLVDRKLLAYEFVYGGSGDPFRTLKIAPEALLVLNEESRLIDVPAMP